VLRTLTVQLRGAADAPPRLFRLRWRGGSLRGSAGSESSAQERIQLCVPARGYAEVRLSVSGSSQIPGDLKSIVDSSQPRQGGLLVSGISLADEVGGPC
jgi:hypothetical protein